MPRFPSVRSPVLSLVLAGVSLAVLASCAAPAPADAPPPPPPPADGQQANACHADPAQSFVGKTADADTVAAAVAAAGAKPPARVLKPGQPMTMDYRFDRLNIEVDDRNTIVKLGCG